MKSWGKNRTGQSQREGEIKVRGKTMKLRKRTAAQKARQKARRKQSSPLDRVPVDISRLNPGLPWIPTGTLWLPSWLVCENGVYYYEDKPFCCKDCGCACVWRAKDQKWWYETMYQSLATTAVRCRACRSEERKRKAEARRVSEEGKERKLARLAGVAE